mgnify:CR=1 FL=1
MYAAVASGGVIGAMLSYSVFLLMNVGFIGINGRLATVIVNLCNIGLMGFFADLALGGFMVPEAWCAFIAIGLVGAMTIFSSFALDTAALFQKQVLGMAMLCIAQSLYLLNGSFAQCYWFVRLQS